MALSHKLLSIICPTASHNVPALVLAGDADLVEHEGVLHRGLVTRIRGAEIMTLPGAGQLSRLRARAELAAVSRRILTIFAGKRPSATMLTVVGADYGQRIMVDCIHAPLAGLSCPWPDNATNFPGVSCCRSLQERFDSRAQP